MNLGKIRAAAGQCSLELTRVEPGINVGGYADGVTFGIEYRLSYQLTGAIQRVAQTTPRLAVIHVWPEERAQLITSMTSTRQREVGEKRQPPSERQNDFAAVPFHSGRSEK